MNQPFEVSLEKDKQYYWCTCGLSKKNPFCDGSHKESTTDLKSHKFTCDKADKAWLCGCKQTKNPPFCDGSHNEICDA